MGLFTKAEPTMVTPDEALPGSEHAMQVRTEHAVLGTPMRAPWPDGHEVLYVGMGCFWGAERIFWQIDGVYSTAVGYMGGWTMNATYEQVCTGKTGHTEAVQIVYDPDTVDVQQLLKQFWEQHDPTTLYRQGNDVGTQYRSAIYPTTDDQLQAARESRLSYQRALDAAGEGQIVTEIVPAENAGDGVFHYAEDYHQQYLDANPSGYCNHGFCQAEFETAS